jgi:hypothetical protein
MDNRINLVAQKEGRTRLWSPMSPSMNLAIQLGHHMAADEANATRDERTHDDPRGSPVAFHRLLSERGYF